MAWTRRTDTNRWKTTVRTPAGRRTVTHDLKGVVENWAAEQETAVRHGNWIDPRAGKITVGQWWERTRGARHLEQASRRRDESHWRCHVAPRWAKVPVGAILKPDVSAWVVEMERSHRDDCVDRRRCPGCKVGAATIEGAVGVLRALMDLAVDARLRYDNPARGIAKPRRDAHVDRVLDSTEEELLLARLDELFPGRGDAGLFVRLILDTGLRWEEAAAIPPEMVDTRRQRVAVAWVMERDGTTRPYAKSDAGNRQVAYGDGLAKAMTAAKLAAPGVPGVFPRGGPGRLLFVSPGGGGARKRGEVGPLRYSGWHRRVWLPALLAPYDGPVPARTPGTRGPLPVPRGEPYLSDPQPTPHDLRHTYGTRLADEGVPIHDIMALMGHADIRSAQRYLHSREERFARARQALSRARGVAAESGS